MAELKPCPFCGGKARRKTAKYNLFGAWGTAKDVRESHAVYCPTCKVGQPMRKYETVEAASEAWNRRVNDGR